jgi:hypothetical protein
MHIHSPSIYTWWKKLGTKLVLKKMHTEITRLTLEDKNLMNLSCSENASKVCYFHMIFTILSLVPTFATTNIY